MGDLPNRAGLNFVLNNLLKQISLNLMIPLIMTGAPRLRSTLVAVGFLGQSFGTTNLSVTKSMSVRTSIPATIPPEFLLTKCHRKKVTKNVLKEIK